MASIIRFDESVNDEMPGSIMRTVLSEYFTSSLFKVLAMGLGQYLVLKMIYNVFFHPLKNYPGPWILASSCFPITYGNLTGQSSHWALRLHEKYGHIVRMAPNELSYSNASSWNDIYGSHPARPGGMPRDRAFTETLDHKASTPSLLNVSPADHARLRRAYAKALSKRAIRRQTPLIMEHVSSLIQTLENRKSLPIDMHEMFAFTIADITVDVQLGSHLNILHDKAEQSWVQNMFGLVRSATILATLAEFPAIKWVFRLVLPQLIDRARDVHFGWVNKTLDRRLALNTERADVVQHVREQAGPEDTVSDAELRANSSLILLAQHEAVTTALCGSLGFLLEAPVIFKQLQEEVRSKFRCISDLNMEVMEGMTILNACINEALRLYPPAPAVLPCRVPPGGATISGEWVPSGTRVYTSPLATFKSSANFHKPESFLPQRWYPEPDAEFYSDDRESWKPYSIGTSDCIGRHVAHCLITYVLCAVILNFDFEQDAEDRGWHSNQKIWQTWDKPPLSVRLTTAKPHI